jgi:phage-related protein
MADLKEGRELGPGIAKMNDGATDMWLSIREILLPIKKLIVDQLGDFLSKTGDAMSLVADVVTPAVEVLTKILDVLFTIARYASPIGIGVSLLSLIKSNTDEKLDEIEDWDEFIKNAMNVKVGFKDEAFRREDRPRNRPNNMNVPLFAGI